MPTPEPTRLLGVGPAIGSSRVQTPGQIEKYARFEVAFDILGTVATNMYFPYDPATPPGVESGTGISVDALFLAPGASDWATARVAPCFYYQPVEEVGSGAQAELLPVGKAEWRCRFSPDIVGEWQYKIQARDAAGLMETAPQQFTCVDSNLKGPVRVSPTDSRMFEFSDGTPFVYPLINVEDGNPLNSLVRIRTNIQKWGQNGVRFVRWFPTGEGANYYVIPYGDDLTMSWAFGSGHSNTADVDSASGKKFSFSPYYYSSQDVRAIPGARYRLSFRAKVTGDRVLRAQIAYRSDLILDICSSTSTYHESVGCNCNARNGDWQDYSLEFTNGTATNLNVALRGLYVSSDAPAPFNAPKDGQISIHSIQFQRDETGQGDWGPNLLTRSDPDTYNYVDQVGAARLDEVLRLSEQYGVYHKLTLFHKNDAILNRFQADGSIGNWFRCSWGRCPNNFYSADGQAARWYERAYTRYFLARWGYSPALHSLELGNENDLTTEAYNAGFALAEYVRSVSPRYILMSNSFWGWFVDPFWTDPTRGYLMDYADKHWYANPSGSSNGELISTIINDSAANVRQTWSRFREYGQQFNYQKPIVRGEAGVAASGTQPQHPDIARDTQGVYYHKQLWAHVGTIGYQCGGEWYPYILEANNLWGMYAAYERFMSGEPVSNGNYQEIGTDLSGVEQILTATVAGSLRAWGVRDASAGKVLLWIDNASHTWRNVVDGVSIPPASAGLTIQGLPQGTYTAQWWDTVAGTVAGSETYVVGADGQLAFTVSDLATDKALKLIRSAEATPTPTDLPTHTPTVEQSPTPTSTPSPTPTDLPTHTPTATHTAVQSPTPTRTATSVPTATPTQTPTSLPSPTATPTVEAKPTPTSIPYPVPTDLPTSVPKATPTATYVPNATPTAGQSPTPMSTANVPKPTAQFQGATLWLAQFGSASQAGGWTNADLYPRSLADVNGDGKADVVGFGANGVYVSLSTGASFGAPGLWVAGYGTRVGGWTSQDLYPRLVADVNGDGKGDIVGFGAKGTYVSLSTGSAFAAPVRWIAAYGTHCGGWSSQDKYPRLVADVNGDHKADVVGFGKAGVYVSLSTGSSFAASTRWIASYGYSAGGWTSQGTYPRLLGDVNGDGVADVVGFGKAGVYVSLSTGTGFAPQTRWISNYGYLVGGKVNQGLFPRAMADAGGEGKADIVSFSGSNVYLSASSGSSFASPVLVLAGFGPEGTWASQGETPCTAADVNGEGKADLVGFSPNGVYVALAK